MNSTIILKGNILYTPRPSEFVAIQQGYVIAVDGVVVHCGESIPPAYGEHPITDYGDHLIIPGFVDTHAHAPQYCNRGLGMDKELLPWLETYTFPEEAKFSDQEYARLVYGAFVHDLWRNGTTRSILFGTIHKDSTLVLMELLQKAGLSAYVGKVNTKDTTKDEIISMMVGRTIYEDPKAASTVAEDAPVVLEVKNLCAGTAVKDVSFKLHKGEILGFSGLMGAGRTEVARLLFGADKKENGSIVINGKEVSINSPQDAIREGIGYLSEDRKRFGCIVDMTIANNTVITNLDKYIKAGLIDDGAIVKASDQFVQSLHTKTPSSKQLVRNLSGGNQQKVVIAKWLEQNSDILIFDEPTRGIDVGAKSEIYTLMNDLVAQGKSIIMISSELTEILRMSDRIVVMCEGRKTGELDISQATQERILALATDR